MASSELPTVEEEKEHLPLLQHLDHRDQPFPKCPLRMRYRLPMISEKGAVIMIVWNVFFCTSFCSCGIRLVFGSSQLVLIACMTVIYPIVGWLADSWFGKYRFLQCATYLLLAAIIIKAIETFFVPSSVLAYLAVTLWSLTAVCYYSSVIQFTTDQMIGASGEELSFTIYWLVWGWAAGELLSRAVDMLEAISVSLANVALFTLSAVSFIITFSIFQSTNHFLLRMPRISKPISLIIKVLNYARKHNYPERRSALTYWEDDYPARIDLGKDKYGGPFTTEEVEDVKTVLRLLPVIISVAAHGIACWNNDLLQELNVHRSCYNSSIKVGRFHNILFHNDMLGSCAWATVGLPLFHFIIYPVFYNHIPSMLKRIGFSLLLVFLSFLGNLTLEFIEQANASKATCMLDKDHDSTSVSVSCLWALLPNSILSLSTFTLLFCFLEFLIAQAPWQIKSLLMSLALQSFAVFSLLGYGLADVLKSLPVRVFPGCGFYFYLTYSVESLLCFLLFVLVSRKYKLRKRDDIVPYHLLAEEVFEKNYQRKQDYLQSMGFHMYEPLQDAYTSGSNR